MNIFNALNEDENPFKIEFNHFPEYLYVFIGEGRDSFEVSKKYWFRIIDECKKEGVAKLLIDEDLEGTLPSNEAYQLSTLLADTSLKNILIAFVDRRAEQSDSNQFSELIYTNRGGRVKLFKKIKEARQWLLNN
jgi:hypothetical protein